MRRLDMEEFLGYVPAPQVEDGNYLVEILFKVGPYIGELPLTEADLEPWERRRGVELDPWEAEIIVDLSKSYLRETVDSKEASSLCPWPPGRGAWKMTQDLKHSAEADAAKEKAKESSQDGNRKRHRNPSPR